MLDILRAALQAAVVDMNDPDLDALTIAWGGEPPAQIASDYRQLDRDARRTALVRISALQRLTRGPRPSRRDQEAIAAELGVGLKRLQALMREWVQPSVPSITPGARPSSRSTAPRPGVQIARRIVAKALSRNRRIAEPTVHRRIAAVCARLGCPTPARMTVRSLLHEARRSLPPPDIDWIGIESAVTITTRKEVEPGEVLILTIETLRARIRHLGRTDDRPGLALVLADAATGCVLAALPAHAVDRLGCAAADGVRALGPSAMAVWHPPRMLVLGPPTPDERWEAAMRRNAEGLSIAVTRETRRSTRRWTSSLLWRGTDELAPIPTRMTDAGLNLPLYTEEAFEAALAHCGDKHNARVEEAVDMGRHNFGRTSDGDTGAAVHAVAALFTTEGEKAEE